MSKPIVAIVGRPNVGKSQLFNRFAGRRLSIVEDTPGVTRDRLYADAEWRGREFQVIDTGGIEPSTDSEILQFMRMQAETAIMAADVIILITDLRTGVTAADQDVAAMLRRSKTNVTVREIRRRSFMNFTTSVWAIQSAFPRCTATEPAICSTSAISIFRRRPRRTPSTTTSRLQSSVSPMSASPR